MRKLGLLVILLLFPGLTSRSEASTVTYEDDCYTCNNTAILGIDQECGTPPDYSYGTGTTCHELRINGLPTACYTSGFECYRITVNGGGGGSGGTGGGGSCHSSGFCPAECFSCSGGGRPRI